MGREKGACVCARACVHCEVNRTRWRRSGLSWRLQFLGNTLSSAAPLACMRVCNSRVYLSIAYMTSSCYRKTAGSVTHHLLRIQGHRGKRTTFGFIFLWVLLLDLNYAAFTSTKDVLVIWTTKNVSGWGFRGVGDISWLW